MKKFLILVFMLSGVSGLIYESVWSHYIKLLLGHAAYAQSLVLVIFMGGMAIGAWLVSHFSQRIRNLLLAYAIVEILIGILGIGFHPVFRSVSAVLMDSVIPAVGSSGLVTLIKISVAALLILPQSILLGATFPLVTGGIIRRWPDDTGGAIAILYFANSIGAVIGVLWSGFWLIAEVGLPGTLMTAGLINIVIAICVYLPGKISAPPVKTASSGNDAGPLTWLLWAAAITGAASFCYEIAWIRMLSMVLGASTHSFEMMLAAFILGLALGGLWIRRRIDTIANPRQFLGRIQLIMGVLALLTLPLYDYTFDLMSQVMLGLGRTNQGYVLFSLTGHAIALLIMLPATFCAGMTLPLLTLLLWRKGAGEVALGRIYAANTLGAIVGVLVSVHLIMPLLGLKYLLVAGALMDGLLGIYLLGKLTPAFQFQNDAQRRSGIIFACILIVIAVTPELDPLRMASSVYRTATPRYHDSVEVLRWADGKTASIGLTKTKDGRVAISTNGKTDAAINMSGKGLPLADEFTMSLAAIIPMMYKPDIQQVANVGFGSGLTTHTLLANPGIRQLDTVEIEPEMIKSAQLGFGKRVSRAFDDDRSHIYIEDARVHFAKQGKRYDLIVSEPSNPWVSGVASLFSSEYYGHVRRYLTPDGLFVQWLQQYETDASIVASILSSLGNNFADYHLYATNDGDMLVIASPRNRLSQPLETTSVPESLAAELRLIGLAGWGDLKARYLGNKMLWAPWIARQNSPENSDYFPFVDLNAARFRFMNSQAQGMYRMRNYAVPVLELLDPSAGIAHSLPLGRWSGVSLVTADRLAKARQIRDAIRYDKQETLTPETQAHLALLKDAYCPAAPSALAAAMQSVSEQTAPYLSAVDMDKLWGKLVAQSSCLQRNGMAGQWLRFYRAVGARDAQALAQTSGGLLDTTDGSTLPPQVLEQLVVAEMVAHLVLNDEAGFSRSTRQHLMREMEGRRLLNALPAEYLIAQATARGWKL